MLTLTTQQFVEFTDFMASIGWDINHDNQQFTDETETFHPVNYTYIKLIQAYQIDQPELDF